MVQVTLNLRNFRRRVKIRYPILIILAITLVFTIPFIADSVKWAPPRSVISDSEFGHSNLYHSLSQDYQVKHQSYNFDQLLETNDYSSNLLIIIAPEIDYTTSEMSDLSNYVQRGGNVLILGTTESTIILVEYFDIIIGSSEGRIFDRENNYGISGLIQANFNDFLFLSVTPYSIFTFPESDSNNIYSSSTAISELRISTNVQETIRFQIGSINGASSQLKQLSYFADNWAFSNNYTDLNPQNLELLPLIISQISSSIDSITFDETHYNYLPVNRNGVTAMLFRFAQTNNLIFIIAIFTILLPFMISQRSGLLSKNKKGYTDENLSKKIAKRLETLHIKSVPAVPLSGEERYLTENRLLMLQRKGNYFQIIIAEILRFISEENMDEVIDPQLIIYLRESLNSKYSSLDYWKLIEWSNYEIDIIEKKMREAL